MRDIPDDAEEVIMCHRNQLAINERGVRIPCPVCETTASTCKGVPREDVRQSGPSTVVIHAARHERFESGEAEA